MVLRLSFNHGLFSSIVEHPTSELRGAFAHLFLDANYEKICEIENIFRKKIIGNVYARYINRRRRRLTLIMSSPSIRAAVNLTSARALLVDAGNHLMRDLNDGLSRRCLEGGVYSFLMPSERILLGSFQR